MKLSDAKPYFESSGEMQEHFFSVQDQGMIFDILRSKMYSNPILAICREITSNARDAHREVGKPDDPIHIHLPFGLEPDFKIKDFGPGISPDRMVNIFIKYTASTKRNDNLQTGGFGLGAKTPFSYSDQFSVTTVHDGIRYSYICIIDETKVGKLVMLDKRSTDEPNSTEISIPVKPIDFSSFRQYVEQACRHWTTKPVITGGTIEWQTFNKVLEGNGWAITATNDWQQAAKLVIDGIEYPLELNALRKYADPKLIDAARGNFIMYFGVGELSLSANREQIFLDKPTQEKIRERLNEITAEVKKTVEEKIDTFPNLWDANVFYRRQLTSAFSNLSFLGKLQWKGHTLSNEYVEVKCPLFSFTRGRYSRKYGHDPNRLSRSTGHSFHFQEKTQLIINDLPIKEPTPRHLKKFFESNPDLQTAYVICPNDKQTEADLDKAISLNELQPKRLSDFTKASKRNYTPAAFRLLVFKFDPIASAFRQVSYDSVDQDTNTKVLCKLNRDDAGYRETILKSGNSVGNNVLRALLKNSPNTSFYGVGQDTDAKRVEEDFSDFSNLDDFIEENVVNNKTMNYVEIKFAQEYVYEHGSEDRFLKSLPSFRDIIDDKQSLFLRRLELHQKLKDLNAVAHDGMLEIYESAKGAITEDILNQFLKDHPEWDIVKMNKEYSDKYPLLDAVQTYHLHNLVPDIAQYVNLIDKI